MTLNWISRGVGQSKTNPFLWGGMDIFWNYTLLILSESEFEVGTYTEVHV